MEETAAQCLCRRCAELSALCLRHRSCFRCTMCTACTAVVVFVLFTQQGCSCLGPFAQFNFDPDQQKMVYDHNAAMPSLSKLVGTVAHVKVLARSSEVILRCPDQHQSMYNLLVESLITTPREAGTSGSLTATASIICVSNDAWNTSNIRCTPS